MGRIRFLKFRNKLANSSQLSRKEVSLFAPILYEFEDKYYDACDNYLDTGEETELVFNEYSTSIIKHGMECSYIESLIILHNIEAFPSDGCFIYTPKIIE